MYRPIHICLKRLDAAYDAHNHFARLKARLLLGVNLLLIALVSLNLLRFLWFPPPALPLRICINLIIATSIIACIRLLMKGKVELAGSSLALGLALPIHLIVAFLPGDFYAQPLGTAFQLFVFDIFLLLLSLIFASKRTAICCFAIVIVGNIQLYFKTLADVYIPGTLHYAAGTLVRDGVLAYIFIFSTGFFLVLMLELVTKKSEQMLQTVKSMNARLEGRVRKRTKELEAVSKQANDATHAKSDFLANMSHEIRTPLFSIIAQTELLKDQADRFSEQDLEDLNVISESGDFLLRLINDILDFSKIEAHQLELESCSFSLTQSLDECISTVAPSAKKKQLKVKFLKSEELKISLSGDSHRLKQIILNLLSNAIKFTRDGGEITVVAELVAIEDGNARIQFKVVDTGIGMDETTRQNIFKRFTQAESSTTRQYGGSGLGLAISSQLVSLMGGQLTVESELGAGSSFQFALVLPVVETPEPPAKSKNSLGESLGMHILIAEDNIANQLIVCRQLEALGCTYEIADNGEEALEILKSDDAIELVLMDNTMPVMDGQRATKIIRGWESTESHTQRRAAKLPIVMFTANVIDASTFEQDFPHMNDLLTKPLRIQQLRAVLEKYQKPTALRVH